MDVPTVTLLALVLCALPSLYPASIIRGGQGSYLLDQIRPEPQPVARDPYLTNQQASYFDRPQETLTGRPEAARPDRDCPGCARRQAAERQMTNQELREARIEMIKQQILEKLKLERPPNVTVPRPAHLPEPLHVVEEEVEQEINSQAEEDEDDFYGKTTEVIIFASEDTPEAQAVANCHTTRPAGCFHFTMKDSLQPDEVKSAELWVYKQLDPGYLGRNQTLVVSRLGSPNHSATQVREIVDIQDTTLKRGWVKFDVKRMVRQWLHHPLSNHGLEVSCKDCNWEDEDSPVASKAELKPFIIIHTREQHHRRNKRSAINCRSDTEQCCLERLEINFADIGWDSWILQPEYYEANFCRGSCLSQGGPWLPGTRYTALMQLLSNMETGDEDLRDRLTPCCAPTRLGSLSLLFVSDSGLILKHNLPNMIVESCGCM